MSTGSKVSTNFPGNLFVVAAPSGAGKSSLVNALLAQDDRIRLSVSCTTRAPRGAEIDGVHYVFIDREEFQRRIDAGEFLEWAEVHGNLYGTSRRWLEERMAEGVDVLLEIDWQGAAQVRAQFANAVSIFILPPSFEELRRRLTSRAEDAPEVIEQRLREARIELAQAKNFDFIIVNQDFTTALNDLRQIVGAQRLRYAAQRLSHPEVFRALGIL
ncbi:MAG: guanylate kinase [Thiomonas sp.]|jgi:guanylate kinase